jgi:hypothetical protein
MHPTEEDLVMLYYRERPELRAHVDACPACTAAYRNLARVLDACDDLPVPEPHPAFESRMWSRLEPQLHPRPVLRNRWFALAAAAAMLVAAFLAGRFTRPHNDAQQIVAISADGRQRVLLMALGDHLERSQMVLAELANGPDQAPEFAEERTRARNLISDNRLYRQTASEAGDPALAQVLDQLERVLLDISHGTDPEEIKSRIEQESLLFKLRVLGSNLHRASSPASAGTKEKL